MIDPDALIRQLKIALITGEPNEIIHWFENNIWNKLKATQLDFQEDRNAIVYHIDHTVIFYYNDINFKAHSILWSDYLRPVFVLNYAKGVIIIHLLLESYLNHTIPVPTRMQPYLRKALENILLEEELL